MRTFVMGDIHGAHKAMIQCFERSGFDTGEDRLIQLGDVTDGNPDVFECVETLLSLDRLISIKGNHDQWFEEFIRVGLHPAFFSHGGLATALSYMVKAGHGKRNYFSTGYGYKVPLNQYDIPAAHRQFFTSQRLYFVNNENQCFVHGGFNRLAPFNGQREETYYWDRELWQSALNHVALEKEGRPQGEFQMVDQFDSIFIGHTPTTKWHTDQPMRALNIFNIDTGAGHNGRLTIMDVDTKEFW